MSSTPSTPTTRATYREDKENRPLKNPRKSIEWADHKEVFTFSPTTARTLNAASIHLAPRKSILKPPRPLQPFPQEKRRDITPQPDEALLNSEYLAYPVSVILANDSALRELTEAYSILAARIRASVPPTFLVSSQRGQNYPLFKPLKQNAHELCSAIVRDLGRVFEDPFSISAPTTPFSTFESVAETCYGSSSEKAHSSKKGGMTEEQVKYARDLSTVSTATIKFLILAFQVPAVYSVFSKTQLDSILTAALAIPLADSLRSPTARKICGFVITFLQSQKLPKEVLLDVRDRIVFALRRALDGELGREGKKGAICEALRAVHDLSLSEPLVFIPSFSLLLGSIFDNLLAPQGALRVQAAHALGGFVLGITRPENDFTEELHHLSDYAVSFFLGEDAQVTIPQTPIWKALKTALRTLEPSHPSQGPFWAISVLASLIILFGPALLQNRQLLVAFRALVDLGLKTKKKPVRAATSTLWGPLIWIWQNWKGSIDLSNDDAHDPDVIFEHDKVKAIFSQMLRLTTHMPVGTSFIGALLGDSHETCQRQDLLMALFELASAARQGGDSTPRALEVLDRMINAQEDAKFYSEWSKTFLTKLISKPLLSVSPGLLTMESNGPEFMCLIESAVSCQPSYADIRPLSDEERCLPGVWTRTKDAWVACLEQLQMSENEPVSEIILEIWSGLIRMGLLARDDSTSIKVFAEQCANVLVSILGNKAIDLLDLDDYEGQQGSSSVSPKSSSDTGAAPESYADSAASMRLKLALVRSLWATAIKALPISSQGWTVKPLVRYLIQHHRELVPSNVAFDTDEMRDGALSEWAQLWAQISAVSPSDITAALWDLNWEWDSSTRARVWRGYARGWMEDMRGSWKGAVTALGLPFRSDASWNMSDADLKTWNSLLMYAIELGSKEHIAVSNVLEHVAQNIDRHVICSDSILRIADHLLEVFDKAIEYCSSLPSSFVDFIHGILYTLYPPDPQNKLISVWLLRSLQSAISNCPSELIIELLEALQDGLCSWIGDQFSVFSNDEYSAEVLPLFQTTLISLQSLPLTGQVLQSLAGILASPLPSCLISSDAGDKFSEAVVSLKEFWLGSCASLAPPRDGWSTEINRVLATVYPVETTQELPVRTNGLLDERSNERDDMDKLTWTRDIDDHTSEQLLVPSPIISHKPEFAPHTPMSQKSTSAAAARPQRHATLQSPILLVGSPQSPSATKAERRRIAYDQNTDPVTAAKSGQTLFSAPREKHMSADKENVSPPADDDEIAFGTGRAITMAGSSPLRGKRQRTSTSVPMSSDEDHDCSITEQMLLVIKGRHSPVRNDKTTFYVPASPQTPSKRPRSSTTKATSSKAPYSASKRRRVLSQLPGVYNGSDDDLPPSDIESEEEMSESSSPLGPSTPCSYQTNSALKVRDDLPSDDSILSSSPTSHSRRAGARQPLKGRGSDSIAKRVFAGVVLSSRPHLSI